MSSIASYNFPKAYKGDTYKQIGFTMEANGLPIDITDAEIRMWLAVKSGVPALKLTTADSSIVVTNAANGVFHIPAFIVEFPAAAYNYDLEIKYSDGRIKTYMRGVFEVINDITKPD